MSGQREEIPEQAPQLAPRDETNLKKKYSFFS
jgi:hypothetical protein